VGHAARVEPAHALIGTLRRPAGQGVARLAAAANPDFSIALDHVARIEVVRGPASSLYGNGGLTAVIHIFTRSGEEVGRTALSAGVGTFGQTKLSALVVSAGVRVGHLWPAAPSSTRATGEGPG